MTNKYLEKIASIGSAIKTMTGARGRLYAKAADRYKYRAALTSNPTLKEKLINRAQRADLRKSIADKDTAHSRRLLPESFIEGAAKAAPGAAIAAVSGYLIGRKKEKDVESAKRAK